MFLCEYKSKDFATWQIIYSLNITIHKYLLKYNYNYIIKSFNLNVVVENFIKGCNVKALIKNDQYHHEIISHNERVLKIIR